MVLGEEDVKSIWNITNPQGIFLFLGGIHLGLVTGFTVGQVSFQRVLSG